MYATTYMKYMKHEIHEVGQSPAYLKPTKYHQTDMKFTLMFTNTSHISNSKKINLY